MPTNHLLPIPLPHGRTGNVGHLSVFLSPRLLESGALEPYNAWRQWSRVASALSVEVLIDGVAAPNRRVGVEPDDDLWANAFAPMTPVRGHRFVDWSSVDLAALATSDFDTTILSLYAQIAASHPTNPPSRAATMATAQAETLLAPAGPLDQAVDHVSPMEGDDLLEATDAPNWDFHSYVAMLGHHPELLRHLGLVIDLEVDLAAHPEPGAVVVRTDFDDFSADGIEIPVELVTTADFLAQPNWETPGDDPGRYWEQSGGFLRLQHQKAYASLLDTVGAAVRLSQVGSTGRASENRDQAEGTGALPALSTRALTLVRPDLTTAFQNRTVRQGEIEAEIAAFLTPPPGGAVLPRLFAEDISRGHRIDVLDQTAPGPAGPVWRSLFERTSDGGYRFPHVASSDPDKSLDRPAPDDEGWTTTRLVTEHNERPEGEGDDHMPIVPLATRRLDDQLYRWDGWSGAAPRPSGAIDSVTGAEATVDVQEPTEDDPLQFAVEYQARPGSLPRLRFSHRYRMRARTVDLGGWSPSVDSPSNDEVETADETFGRLEPIASPTVVRRNPRPWPGVGDLAATIVLRSDYDVDDATVDPDERLLFPGRVGQDLCELHGRPDGGVDTASHTELAQRDRVRPEDDWEIDERSGEPVAGGPDRHPIGYLADPMIASLRVDAPSRNLTELVPLTESWPELTSLRLLATTPAGQAGPGGDEPILIGASKDIDVLVRLAKADIWSVELSYGMGEDAIEQFGLWHQLEKSVQNELVELIGDGGHWMFSARQTVRLVHAVRRPLREPAIGHLGGSRTRGATAVTLESKNIDIERRSTGTVALRARWTDLVDDPSLPAPAERDSGAFLGRFTTPRSEADEPFTFGDHRVDLGDTRRHLAAVDIEAFSAFSSYFTEERTIHVSGGGRVEIDSRGIGAGTAIITVDGRSTRAGVDHVVDETTGTVRFPAESSLKEGQELVVRYIPRPVSRTTEGAYELLFPNTAIPAKPDVLEANPAFERHRVRKGTRETVSHDGRIVRIHLARPWNLTGDGESLAVLVDPSGRGAAGTGSHLARDPLLAGPTPDLTVDSFRLATAALATEGPNGDIELAVHPVSWDDDLGHWYCDVAIDVDGHRPFVTLVVARYQPDSIPGRHLGRAVTLDPIQLGPDRTVEAVRSDDHYRVLVTGATHEGVALDDRALVKVPGADPEPELGANEFVVRVQQADPSIIDLDLRWSDDVNQVALVPTAGNGHTGWGGDVPIPAGGLPHRLVIEERRPALIGAELAEVTTVVVHDEIIDFSDPPAKAGDGAEFEDEASPTDDGVSVIDLSENGDRQRD